MINELKRTKELLDGCGDRPLAFATRPCLLEGCDEPQNYRHSGFCSRSHSDQYINERLADSQHLLTAVGQRIMNWDFEQMGNE